jgi:hypothetical protein
LSEVHLFRSSALIEEEVMEDFPKRRDEIMIDTLGSLSSDRKDSDG